ncbi:MAG: hypothetical protein ACFCUT_07415 [Kiloniellaceae bacterium]
MSYKHHGLRLLAATLALNSAASLAASSIAAAEEQTINAFSAWTGEGVVYDSGPNTGTFVGAISGALYVHTDKGPASAGLMVCPAMLEIDLVDATQLGQGKCTITGDDGAKVFAEWTCQGVHLIGCDGEFKLTGGSGRMEGIIGTGSLTVRTTTRVASTAAMLDGAVTEIGSGILLLEDLVYTLPVQ